MQDEPCDWCGGTGHEEWDDKELAPVEPICTKCHGTGLKQIHGDMPDPFED